MMGISLEEYRKLQGKDKSKKNKYGSKSVVIDGIRFKSIKEGRYYKSLKLLKKAGHIINFYVNVPFYLPGKIKYELDFLEVWHGGIIKHVDTKGLRTRVYINKKKQVEEIYQIKIEEV